MGPIVNTVDVTGQITTGSLDRFAGDFGQRCTENGYKLVRKYGVHDKLVLNAASQID